MEEAKHFNAFLDIGRKVKKKTIVYFDVLVILGWKKHPGKKNVLEVNMTGDNGHGERTILEGGDKEDTHDIRQGVKNRYESPRGNRGVVKENMDKFCLKMSL